MLKAGRLRHHLRLESPTRTQHPTTGEVTTTWTTVVESIACAIEPVSAKDFIAAQAVQSKVTVRLVIRHRAGLKPNMRFVAADGTVYQPHGFLPDTESGREYLTAPCTVTES